MIAATHKNAATAGTVTALRINAVKERTMPEQFSTSEIGLLESIENLIDVASETFTVRRHGFIFERSGDSMAVFDGCYRIDRVTLTTSTERGFLEAIDAWELARYMEAA